MYILDFYFTDYNLPLFRLYFTQTVCTMSPHVTYSLALSRTLHYQLESYLHEILDIRMKSRVSSGKNKTNFISERPIIFQLFIFVGITLWILGMSIIFFLNRWVLYTVSKVVHTAIIQTFFFHIHLQAFLETTRLALISSCDIHNTISIFLTHII